MASEIDAKVAEQREARYMEPLMEQTYRVACYGRKLSHGHMVNSPHVVGLIACYRDLADLLERVLDDNGMSKELPRLPVFVAACGRDSK